MGNRSKRARWIRRGVVLVGGLAVIVAALAPQAAARRAAVPVPAVALPPAVDWQAEYQGQTLCSDWAKPGAVKLANLLRRTYGKYITYITRSCSTPGISEHEEGRAIDWMVNSTNPTARAKAHAFLKWVTAPGPNGEPAAMARRLGIMYLIYEDKMWRVYRPEDGWREYNGCFSLQDDGYDTSCHRDHIHISLTWDGAYARTSFWTGKAETRGPCASSIESRGNGTPTAPKTLINSDSGRGLAQKHCRLAASDSYHSRAYQIRVPVPARTAGTRPVERIQLRRFEMDAPSSLRIRSATTQSVPQGTKAGGEIDVPLASDGVITFTLGAGYGQLWVRGLGAGGAQSTKPARVTLPRFKTGTMVNNAVAVHGRVKNVPVGATVTVMRRIPGAPFKAVGTSPVTAGKYAATTLAPTQPGTYEYQSVVSQSKVRMDQSAVRSLVVAPADVTLAKPVPVKAGRKMKFSGSVAGAPSAAVLQLQLKAPGGQWATVQQRAVTNGTFKTRKKMATAGEYRARVLVVSGATVWDHSARRRITVE